MKNAGRVKKLTEEEISYLGRLANLDLSPKEIRRYQQQLSDTLSYIKNLDELDTKKIKPTYQAGLNINVYFQDGEKNQRGLKVCDLLAKTKNKKYFMVKRIL